MGAHLPSLQEYRKYRTSDPGKYCCVFSPFKLLGFRFLNPHLLGNESKQSPASSNWPWVPSALYSDIGFFKYSLLTCHTL